MLSSLLIIFQNYLILKEYKKYCSRIIRILIILSTIINTWFETRTFPSVRNLINWKLWKSSSTSDLQSFDRIVTVVTLRLSWRWELLELEKVLLLRGFHYWVTKGPGTNSKCVFCQSSQPRKISRIPQIVKSCKQTKILNERLIFFLSTICTSWKISSDNPAENTFAS